MKINEITEKIIGCAFTVGNKLGPGFLEKVYENALIYELNKCSLKCEAQKRLKVFYDGIIIGEYCADLIVEDQVLVELKAIKCLDDCHSAQCFNYLKMTRLTIGLLFNFGNRKVDVKRIVNHYYE